MSVVSTESIILFVQLAYWFFLKQQEKIVEDHKKNKYVQITKDCLWNELQNYCVESTEKKYVCRLTVNICSAWKFQ